MNRWVFCFIFLYHFFLFGQKSREQIDLLNQIISKRENHILNKSKSIKWQEYNQSLLTSDVDKITKLFDTIWRNKEKGKFKVDSSSYRFKNFNQNKHFYQSEANTNHERKNFKHRSIITKYKVGGFEQPIYETLALELYSKSVYDNTFYFMHSQLAHPLSKIGLKKYRFEVQTQEDVYVISFKGNNSRKIYGYFVIEKDNLNIKEAVIQKDGFLNIKTKYTNIYNENYNTWLPAETILTIKKGARDKDLSLFGSLVYLSKEREKQYFSDYLYFESFSNYLSFKEEDIVTNKKKYIAIDFEINDDEKFLRDENKYLTDARNENTYAILDSLSQVNSIEKRVNIVRRFYEGYYPVKQIDINLKRIINFSNYEGLRLGLGIKTNQKFSKKFMITAHAGYGFRDQKMKYFLEKAMRIGSFSDTWLSVSYEDDIREIGFSKFNTDYDRYIFLNLRPLNLTTFYAQKKIKGQMTTKIIPKTLSEFSLSYAEIDPLFDYRFLNRGQLYENYNITSLEISLQWNPWGKYMQTPTEKVVYKNGYPNFSIQFAQSLSGFKKNDFNFHKIDFKTNYRKKFWNKHELKFFLQTGVIFGKTPITHTYSVFPNSGARPEIYNRFDFSGKNTFETMRRNEFFSDRFIFTEIIYEIPTRINRRFQPIFGFVNRFTIGNMTDKTNHLDFNFNTMEKGYLESGVEIFNIYNWFGISALYRHGAYSLPSFGENLALKLNFRIVL